MRLMNGHFKKVTHWFRFLNKENVNSIKNSSCKWKKQVTQKKPSSFTTVIVSDIKENM